MTNYKEWNPSKANRSSANTSRTVRKPKVRYCVLKSPPLVCIRCHMNPVHILSSCFFKTNFVIILPYASRPFNKTLYAAAIKNRLTLEFHFMFIAL